MTLVGPERWAKRAEHAHSVCLISGRSLVRMSRYTERSTREGRMLTTKLSSLAIRTFETTLKGRRSYRYWKALEETQWLAEPALKELQLDRLRNLLRHAF